MVVSRSQIEYVETLTNPKEHNEDNYVYIVHSTDLDNVEGAIKKIKNPENHFSASLIGKLPKEEAKEKLSYHGGVEQTETFYPVGLIVSPAEPDDIKVAWNCDLGVPTDQEELKEWVKEHEGKRKPPVSLLTQSVGSIPYNEMVIQGDEKTEIQGIFYKPYAESQAERIKTLLEEKNYDDVELIPIHDSKGTGMKGLGEDTKHSQVFTEFYNPTTTISYGTHPILYHPTNLMVRDLDDYVATDTYSFLGNLDEETKQTLELIAKNASTSVEKYS